MGISCSKCNPGVLTHADVSVIPYPLIMGAMAKEINSCVPRAIGCTERISVYFGEDESKILERLWTCSWIMLRKSE